MEKNKNPLLDSSLITQYLDKYDIKMIRCGEYIQTYFYERPKTKKQPKEKNNKNFFKDKDTDSLYKESNLSKKEEETFVEYKNIMRSKFSLQRIVKANEHLFKTFITLTFKENIKCIEKANKVFNAWRTNIQKIKKDFVYVSVPEFQKRGAVHYHLLTNLDIDIDTELIAPQIDKENCFDVKYWNKGFTSVFRLNDINIVGYISKYMTKDIDNRLFGKRKYSHSNNLVVPKEEFIDLDKYMAYFLKHIENKEIIYSAEYNDYYGDKITFIEYK